MDQQMQQLVQEVAGALQQGAKPEEVMQAIMEQGNLSQEQAQQIIQAAMQMLQGAQAQQGGAEGQSGSVLEAMAQEDPELLMSLIQEWESLAPEEKQQIVQALQGGGQPQEQAPQQPQGSGMFQ